MKKPKAEGWVPGLFKALCELGSWGRDDLRRSVKYRPRAVPYDAKRQGVAK